MKNVIAAVSLALTLAACGTISSPQGSAPMRTVTFNAASLAPFRAQGIGAGLADLTMTVRVRSSTGTLVHFTNEGTTYDPTGAGTTDITLSAGNGYTRTLLLPADVYDLEVIGKDTATSTALLTYSPWGENSVNVTDVARTVRLTAHSVLSPDDSALAPTLPQNTLYTDTHFTLGLNLRTASVDGQSGTVPTTDIGPVTYSVGAPTDGDLTLPGSKIGVQVTARGTESDSELNVSANFNAWVRVPGTETATFSRVSVNYAKAIMTSGFTADMTLPTVTLSAPLTADARLAATVSGTVSDDNSVQAVRVYDDTTLVGSTDPGDNVAPLVTDDAGHWSLSWMPERVGPHILSVIAADDSGNEARQNSTVTVNEAVIGMLDVPSDGTPHANVYDLQAGVPRTFTISLHDHSGYSFLAFFDPGTGNPIMGPQAPKLFTTELRDPDGTLVPLLLDPYGGNAYDFTNDDLPAGLYTVTVTPTADGRVALYGVRDGI